MFKGLFYLNSEQVDGNTVVCTLGGGGGGSKAELCLRLCIQKTSTRVKVLMFNR